MSKWLPLANVGWPLLVMVLVATGSLFAFLYGAWSDNLDLFLGSSMTGVLMIATIADYIKNSEREPELQDVAQKPVLAFHFLKSRVD